MQQEARLDAGGSADRERRAQIAEGERLRLAREEEQVAEVKRRLDAGDGRDRNLEQRLSVAQRPLVRVHGAQAVAKGAEQRLALGRLRHPLARRREVVRARQRSEIGGQRGRVVEIVALGEHLEQRFAPAVARSAESARALARHGSDRVLGLRDLLLELVARVQMQPRLVLEGVIAHLVPARDDRRQHGSRCSRPSRRSRRRRR